jgi:hypothetical protein
MTMLALSRSVLFVQLRTGRLASVRQGRSRRITVFAILKYIELLEREHAEEIAGAAAGYGDETTTASYPDPPF